MTYHGTVHNGVVVLPPDAHLPEGTEVKVEALAQPIKPCADESHEEQHLLTPEEDSFLAAILKLAKPRPHWPEDFALNHGHYVSGEPKKS